MKIMLRDVRLAFPSLWKPTAPASGGEPAFSASFLMPKSHPQMAELKSALIAVAKEKWPTKFEEVLKALKAGDKLCLHDGDVKSDYEGYAGNMFVSARAKVKPTVIGAHREELLEQDGKPYSGCYVNASLELWAMDNNFGKRINAQLRGVQFVRDGDAFSGGSRAAAADEFEDISAPVEETSPAGGASLLD